MDFYVIGDIHGNYYAFEAAIRDILKHIEPNDAFIFTGDYVGDFPDGSKVVDLMKAISRNYKTYAIKGNRETGGVQTYLDCKKNGTEPNWSLDTTMGANLVCCRELRTDQLEYLTTLPDTIVIREDGIPPIFVKHKMPLTEEEQKMIKEEQMIVLTAHTHEYHTEEKDGIKLFNAGSTGLPDDGFTGSTYGIITNEPDMDWNITGFVFNYDTSKTVASLKAHKDLYERCQGWGKVLELSVLTGINCTALYSFEANRLAVIVEEAKEQGIEPNLDPPEDLHTIFSQGRYANVNYDGSRLIDVLDFLNDDGYTDTRFESLAVLTSEGTSYKKAKSISPEIYNKALENITQIALNTNVDEVTIGRHEPRKNK